VRIVCSRVTNRVYNLCSGEENRVKLWMG